MKRELFIPQHISHLAVNYSIPVIFFASIVSFYTEHIILSYMQYFVYLTSNSHWYCIYKSGFTRNLDIYSVITTLLYATFVSCNYIDPKKANIWYLTVKTGLCVFIINETTLFIGLKIIHNIERRKALMYYVVIIHMLFLHYGFSLASIYCVLP
jgi:hypothetical protein